MSYRTSHTTPTRRTSAKMHVFLGLVFTAGAVAIWLMLNMQNIEELTDTWNRRDAERQQIEALKERIRRLKKQQQSLAFNGVETERLLRERKGLIIPGENVMFFYDEGTTSTAASSATATQSAEN